MKTLYSYPEDTIRRSRRFCEQQPFRRLVFLVSYFPLMLVRSLGLKRPDDLDTKYQALHEAAVIQPPVRERSFSIKLCHQPVLPIHVA